MRILFRPLFLGSAIVLVTSPFAAAQSNGDSSSHPFESGKADKLIEAKPADELKIVSYNIRWRSGEELQQIIRWLHDASKSAPMIIGLQEVDRARKRSGRINTVKALADGLGMHYAWTAPHATKPGSKDEEETGVAILSPYPLTEVTRLVLPNPGPGGRLRVALGATAQVGRTQVRVYSVHSEVRLSMGKKIDQLRAVLDDLQKHPKEMPAIVLGDFNTWEPPVIGDIRKLFTNAGFTTPLPDDESTFYRKALVFDLKFKLDWIWVRGLTPQSYGIDRKLTVSDHFPLWTVATIDSPATAPAP